MKEVLEFLLYPIGVFIVMFHMFYAIIMDAINHFKLKLFH
jgi:hypothetical protein